MAQPNFQILEKAIIHNDIDTFRSTPQTPDALQGDYQDYELLMKALRLGRKRIVNLLLDKGCRVSKPGMRVGTTPLHLAVTKVGWSSIVLKLLVRGAHIDIRNEDGDTPVHVAFLSGAAGSLVDLLLKCYMEMTLVNVLDKDGLGLLHVACAKSHLSVVKALVDIGGSNILSQVSLKIISPYAGWSPLHFAVANGKHSIAKFLCEYEADVGVLDSEGSTPLHLAVRRCDVKMIDILLCYADWNENCVDSIGISHFMAVCAGSDIEIVRQFLRIAADTSRDTLTNTISARVKDLDDCRFAGYTPLHFAAEFGRLGTMQLLIGRGAHCTLNRQKVSPLDLARKRSHESISELLERHYSECEQCKDFGSEAVIIVGVNSNQTVQKSMVFHFNSTFTESQALDQCCLLDISPFPDEQVIGDRQDDCELCQVQKILSIDDFENQYGKDDSNVNLVQKVTNDNAVVRSLKAAFKFCRRFLNRQTCVLFTTIVACIYIVVCIFVITKHKFT